MLWLFTAVFFFFLIYFSYDTWVSTSEVDGDVEDPLSTDRPWKVRHLLPNRCFWHWKLKEPVTHKFCDKYKYIIYYWKDNFKSLLQKVNSRCWWTRAMFPFSCTKLLVKTRRGCDKVIRILLNFLNIEMFFYLFCICRACMSQTLNLKIISEENCC